MALFLSPLRRCLLLNQPFPSALLLRFVRLKSSADDNVWMALSLGGAGVHPCLAEPGQLHSVDPHEGRGVYVFARSSLLREAIKRGTYLFIQDV